MHTQEMMISKKNLREQLASPGQTEDHFKGFVAVKIRHLNSKLNIRSHEQLPELPL